MTTNDLINLRNKTYLIGIDGGVQTGFAVYDRKRGALTRLETLDFWETYDAVCEFPIKITAVIVEAPRLNAPVFERESANKRAMYGRLAMNVGSVKRESQLLAEGLTRAGYQVIEEKPTSAKWDAAYFARVTGWSKRCSQHARDAARLVFGL